MGKGTWIASLVLLIISIATLLFSRLNIGNKGMLFGVFTLSLMSSIIFFMISLYKIMVLAEGKFSNDVKDKMDFEDYFNRMNELLQMQFGDKMVWGSGEDIRMYKRRYKILNEMCLFIAYVGMLHHAKNFAVVYYSVKDGDIEGYIGDPSPKIIIDPFSSFVPTKADESYFGQDRYADRYSHYGRGDNAPLVQIGNKREDSNDEFDNIINKAEQALDK